MNIWPWSTIVRLRNLVDKLQNEVKIWQEETASQSVRNQNLIQNVYTEEERGDELQKRLDVEVASDVVDFQRQVEPWVLGCFGAEIAGDTVERNHRFIEEALELVQACGGTAEDCHALVDYVFGRPVGLKGQEVGGVMVTLACLCLAHRLDMHGQGDMELKRVWGRIDQIRRKQETKPHRSPLPMSEEPPPPPPDRIKTSPR